MFTESFNHFWPGWQALGARERGKGFNKAEIKIRQKISKVQLLLSKALALKG